MISRVAWKLDRRYLGQRVKRTAKFLRRDVRSLRGYADEFLEEIGGSAWGNPNLELYLMVRALRPKEVVETGVNRGNSTSAILRALHANSSGHLTSIDLPTTGAGRFNEGGTWDTSHVPEGGTGLEIPAYLRDRWTLELGPSRDLLPGHEGYDMFFHDSDHSYANQKFEYGVAVGRIAPGGLLASDDIRWSPAFGEASRGHRTLLWPFERVRRGAFFPRGDPAGPVRSGPGAP